MPKKSFQETITPPLTDNIIPFPDLEQGLMEGLDNYTTAPAFTTGFDINRAIEKSGIVPIEAPAYQPSQEQQNSFLLPDGNVNKDKLLNLATDEKSNVSKVKFGDTEVEFTPPPPPPSPQQAQGPIEARTTAPRKPVETAPSPAPPKESGFFGKVGQAVSTPQGALLLAELGQAITGRQPTSFGYQAGKLGEGLARQDAFNQYKDALRRGAPVGPGVMGALTPDLQKAAEDAIRQERKDALEAQHIAVMDAYYEKLTATKPYLSEEIAGQKELIDARKAAEIEVGRSLNNWMNIGKGFVFNWKTGKAKMIYNDKATDVGDINSADYRLFTEMTATRFLPRVYKKYQDKMKELGYDSLVDLQQAISAPESGSVVWGQVFNILDEPDRVDFAKALNQYTMGQVSGVPATSVFQAQVESDVAAEPFSIGGKWYIYDPMNSPEAPYIEVENPNKKKGEK